MAQTKRINAENYLQLKTTPFGVAWILLPVITVANVLYQYHASFHELALLT